MATYTWDTTFIQTTDAEFRTWGQSISTALAAVGLVKTADTGQIDWLTVTAPAAANDSRGYEIWRFDDPAQASAPVFIKIEWASGSTNVRPGIYTTVGTGSDGAGNLTGVLWTGRANSNTTDNATTLCRSYMCYNEATGTFWMSLNPSAAGGGWGFFLMVTRGGDDNGDPDTELIMCWRQTSVPSSVSVSAYRVDLVATISNPGQGWSYPLGSAGEPLSDGVYLPAFYCYGPGVKQRLMPGYFGCGYYDFSPGDQITIDALGTPRNYFALPYGTSGSPTGSGSGLSSTKFLLIWE